jgi:hypothetical protein
MAAEAATKDRIRIPKLSTIIRVNVNRVNMERSFRGHDSKLALRKVIETFAMLRWFL